jgi:hypothetical protein
VTASGIDYQKSLLNEVVEEALDQRLITSDDAENIRSRVSRANSSDEVDECWDDLSRDHELFSRFDGPDAK